MSRKWKMGPRAAVALEARFLVRLLDVLDDAETDTAEPLDYIDAGEAVSVNRRVMRIQAAKRVVETALNDAQARL